MFTGIVEALGVVRNISISGENKTFWIESAISDQLKVDQSVSHSGVCLTVEETDSQMHRITAIKETLNRTNLRTWRIGDLVNLERSLRLEARLDGHLVQGHVDSTATCIGKKEKQGSWEYEFEFPKKFAGFIIDKGSVCLNGISLTAFAVKKKTFKVAIIPFTYEHTNIKAVQPTGLVNIEFDMIGKYILRRLSLKG